jgi:hypothetical protein
MQTHIKIGFSTQYFKFCKCARQIKDIMNGIKANNNKTSIAWAYLQDILFWLCWLKRYTQTCSTVVRLTYSEQDTEISMGSIFYSLIPNDKSDLEYHYIYIYTEIWKILFVCHWYPPTVITKLTLYYLMHPNQCLDIFSHIMLNIRMCCGSEYDAEDF